MIGSRRNNDWAVSRTAMLAMEIDVEFDEGHQQSCRLHPNDNGDGEGGRETTYSNPSTTLRLFH